MTNQVHIDVWSDFVWPWCFLVSSSLERLKLSHNVTVSWRSFELRPPGAPPISPEYRARIEAARPGMVQMAREVYGVEMNPGKMDGTSRVALIGAKVAEAQGLGDAYHAAVFRAYWQEAKDISDRAVLAGVAEAIDLARAAFLVALDERRYLNEVLADIDLARSYGLSGVPALVFQDKYLISGAQPYQTLVRVSEQVRAATIPTEWHISHLAGVVYVVLALLSLLPIYAGAQFLRELPTCTQQVQHMALWGVRSGILNLITMIHIQTENGDALLTVAPLKDFQSIAFSSPTLEQGTAVEVYYRGNTTGTAVGGVYQDGVYTAGEQIASFTISNVVTTVGNGGR